MTIAEKLGGCISPHRNSIQCPLEAEPAERAPLYNSVAAMMKDSEGGLRDLLTKQEIHERLMRSCRGIERRDAGRLHSVYHSDATDDHGGIKGLAKDTLRKER